jgi:hypothetical protein
VAIAYLTDVEGMWDRLRTFADGNDLVRLGDDDRLELAPGATFVYGGDAIDRGPHGRRVVRVLLEAKRRLGDRVVLIGGNRDINKLRLRRELTGHPPEKAPSGLAGADLLRWIFANTMGARDAFDHRRTELGAVSDAEVVDSFLDDPELAAYQTACQLAYRHDETLFVHGGVGRQSVGPEPDLDAWVTRLNTWYSEEMHAYARGGHPAALIAYQAPAAGLKINPRSIVYSRSSDEHNNPLLPEPDVMARLLDAGVHRVVVGHTPNGDSPSLVRDPARGFELVFADNSYARHVQASRIVIDGDALGIDAQTTVDGAAELHRMRFTVRLGEDSPIGLRTTDGRLVKGQLAGGDYLGFRYLPAYKTEQLAIPARELESLSLAPAVDVAYKD